MLKNIIITFFILISMASVGFAQISSGGQQLINNFKQSFKSKKKEQTLAAVRQLRNSPEALEYMKATEKEYYQLYKAYELIEKMEAEQAKGVEGLDKSNMEKTPPVKTQVEGKVTNKDIVENSANQNRPSNSKVGRAYSNQKRMQSSRPANSSQVRNNANQDQTSNSRRARQSR